SACPQALCSRSGARTCTSPRSTSASASAVSPAACTPSSLVTRRTAIDLWMLPCRACRAKRVDIPTVGVTAGGKRIASATRQGAIMKDFFLADEIHGVGDAQCPMCLEEYPEPCGCGGLIHGSGQRDGDDEV